MEQSLPIAANLLYQQASIVADAVLAERTGKVLLAERTVILGRCVELCVA